jgi:PKHD-type hydroxylase
VTRGERLAVVGWVESWVRQPERREALFDLDQMLREVHGREGKSALFDRLAKTRSNLLRMWAGA